MHFKMYKMDLICIFLHSLLLLFLTHDSLMVVHSEKNVDPGLLDVDLLMLWKLKDVFLFFYNQKKREALLHIWPLFTQKVQQSLVSQFTIHSFQIECTLILLKELPNYLKEIRHFKLKYTVCPSLKSNFDNTSSPSLNNLGLL